MRRTVIPILAVAAIATPALSDPWQTKRTSLMSETNETPKKAEDHDFEWAAVEIYGHRRHVGRIREEQRFGAAMLRIDVPNTTEEATVWTTHWYGGGAIFSVTPTTEEAVMRASIVHTPHRMIPSYADDLNQDGDIYDDEAF